MTNHDVRTCRRDETFNAAAQTMWENDIGFLPVADAENRVGGAVTDRCGREPDPRPGIVAQ